MSITIDLATVPGLPEPLRRRAQRFVKHDQTILLYGFPLTSSYSTRRMNELSPPPELSKSELSGSEPGNQETGSTLGEQLIDLEDHLTELCSAVWPEDLIGLHSGDFEDDSEYHFVLVLARLPARNQQLELPNDETLKKLKEILAKDGIDSEPGWFLKANLY